MPQMTIPAADDIYQVGTVSNILQLLKLPDGTIKVLVEGGYRAAVDSVDDEGNLPWPVCGKLSATKFPRRKSRPAALYHSQFEKYVNLSKKVPLRC